MSKTYLALWWTNHVQVTKAGGKRVTRDEHYSELVDSDDLLSRILSRVRRLNGKVNPVVDKASRDYHVDVKQAEKSNKSVQRTIIHEGRKVCTYAVRPIDISITENEADYKLVKDKGFVHVGGARPFLCSSGIVHSGKRGEDVKKALEMVAKAKDDAPPFSVIADKPPTEDKKKVVSKPSKVKVLQAKAKAQHVEAKEKQVKQPEKVVTFKPSKRQLNECERYDVDPFKLPATKPKGMNNKIWKALVVANK